MEKLAPIGPVYQAGTLSGNPVAMEAGLQSLRLLQKAGFYEELERKTHLLLNPLKLLIQERRLNVCIQQSASMFTIFFGKRSVSHLDDVLETDATQYAKLFRFLFERGVYTPPSAHEAWFLSSAHQEEQIKKASDLIAEFLSSL